MGNGAVVPVPNRLMQLRKCVMAMNMCQRINDFPDQAIAFLKHIRFNTEFGPFFLKTDGHGSPLFCRRIRFFFFRLISQVMLIAVKFSF